MAGRPSAVSSAGLDATLEEQPDGRWHLRLVDDSGTVVFENIYVSAKSARDSARVWVKGNYNVETTEAPRRPKPKTQALGPGPDQLVKMMRARAQDNKNRAIGLRAEADRLETEAKRLAQAADSLADDNG